jgi:hypothetical protein
MVVPVRSMRDSDDSFFESWCAEQGVEYAQGVETTSQSQNPEDAEKDELRDMIRQLVAAHVHQPSSSISDLPHVAEEQRPTKSFDLVHEHVHVPVKPDVRPPHRSDDAPSKPERPKKPMSEAERLANAERRARRRAIPDSKFETPAPGPSVDPEAQRELSEVERAMAWRPPR